jgi:SAM-dependent methyltransferase
VADFNSYTDNYYQAVRASQNFVPTKPEVFMEVKARHLVELAEARLGPASTLSFLDVGCGVGTMDRFLAPVAGELHGVDIAQEAVERAAGENPSVSYQIFDGTTLPFEADTLDLTFAINVFHHVPLAGRAPLMREMQRVTRPGGLVVIYEHNPFNPLTRLAVFRCEFDADAILLHRWTVARLMKTTGLDPVLREYILFFPFRSRVAARVERGLRWLPAGAQHCVAGLKGGGPAARLGSQAA